MCDVFSKKYYKIDHYKNMMNNILEHKIFIILLPINLNMWAATCDFQQCGMCDQQRLRPACAYAQSDQSLCKSLEYSMNI